MRGVLHRTGRLAKVLRKNLEFDEKYTASTISGNKDYRK
jgi:hypothetical protein